MNGFLHLKATIHKKALARLGEETKSWKIAYLFNVALKSITNSKHPILLNFDSNTAAISHSLGLTDKQYQKILNLALTEGLVYYKGSNLHLFSKQDERKRFNIKSAKHYQQISLE